MTPTELEAFINRYFGSAVDAFTNVRMKTVLLSLTVSGVTDQFTTYAAFEAKILANRAAGQDWYMRALDKSTSFIYEYFPFGDGTGQINWTASQKQKNI
jgi:hypothetical protein